MKHIFLKLLDNTNAKPVRYIEFIADETTLFHLIINRLYLTSVRITGMLDIALVRIYLMRKKFSFPIGYHITWNYFQGNVFGRRINGDGAYSGGVCCY